MPTGILIDSAAIILGGIVGTVAGKWLSPRIRENLTLVFGICAMGMGITSIGAMQNMPAVILAIIIGTIIGLVMHMGRLLEQCGKLLHKPISKVIKAPTRVSEDEFLFSLVTLIILSCFSSTGIYGAMDLGITGDSTMLISKAILDFFTAIIFACNLGYVVSTIAIPQFMIAMLLFIAARFILPLTTPMMINDFKACGGFMLLATSFRMLKIKDLPAPEMLPALVLAMPFSLDRKSVV